MQTCDVLIVGGGPAGSSCAARLHGAGLDVLVLDKREFPRDKPCAGWVTPQVVDALALDLDDYAQGNVLQPIRGFATGVIGGRQVETRYDHVASYGIRRCEFDHYLLQRCGARLKLGQPLKTFERRGEQWIVNGEIEAHLLIGAGGHFCPVARSLGARNKDGAPVVAAQETEFAATPEQLARCRVDAEIPQLFFCRDLQGYGWVVRKANHLNIGLGRLDAAGLTQHVDDFCAFLRAHRIVDFDVTARFAGHAYQLYERAAPKLVDDGVLLIGDAAGLAYPNSGEGIRPAVESGLLAANAIIDAAGAYRAANLAPYAANIETRFGKPRARGDFEWLPHALLCRLAGRLLATRWFAKSVVIDRWFLHSDQPALVS